MSHAYRRESWGLGIICKSYYKLETGSAVPVNKNGGEQMPKRAQVKDYYNQGKKITNTHRQRRVDVRGGGGL